MRTLRRALVSLGIAVIASLLPIVAYAVTNYVDEFGSYFTKTGSMNSLNCSGCYGGRTRWQLQSGSFYQDTATGKWKSYNGNPSSTHYYWYVFIPNVSGSSYAAVEYFVTNGDSDNFYITVIQGNHKGAWVYLGDVTGPPTLSYTKMGNRCLSGFWCGGLRVYWDHARYTY
jgi:hypothetical protein